VLFRSLEILKQLREVLGEYTFSGQYQQAPSPLGGGLVKSAWFKTYMATDIPAKFEMIVQSWDCANKPAELNSFSVCTTWGVKEKHIYLIHVFRKRLGYPDLKRAVREQAEAFSPQTVLIEDKAAGTQLIQELVSEGMHAVERYEPTGDKVMRMHAVTSTIENGFVHLPDQAEWLGDYLRELASFPKGKYDDQADSTSQTLHWFKQHCTNLTPWLEFVETDTLRTSALSRETHRAGFSSPGHPRSAPDETELHENWIIISN
jgi:predicted phage terminase large subunit-like protein